MTLRVCIPEVQDPDFTADVTVRDGAVLRLVGTADSRARAPLGTLLVALDAELRTRKAREVVVDMTSLDTMSAGCFNELVAWLSRLQEAAADERYKLRFRINRQVQWQAHTLRALSCFDTELITIEPR